ncbi:hypothetical protein NHX12_015063 [Muraenolepis orangiensis]|uniref:BPL/LPL catalytic domain-containing protein n=1 Tax=Muraenolepis orangiensis TaxID=630683 RepID=A0A9Q0DBH6_9TELE|nr:hypothetical protein NHX12_015063 [Muraenolepis orangiensis]
MVLRSARVLQAGPSLGGLPAALQRWVSGPPGGLVLRSLSRDVFQNLALEDWIWDHLVDRDPGGAAGTPRSLLLLWSNSSSVVVGRHQNPWQECDLRLARLRGVPVARRRSGGGTVFHDPGNINLTFFTSRGDHDRQRNLRVVTAALRTLRPGMDVRATDRYDILLDGRYKISGTASRLGRRVAYHHCTLLCSADRGLLSSLLRPTCHGIHSNATPSIPSPVSNLLDHDPSLTSDSILQQLVEQYLAEFGVGPSLVLDVQPSESSFQGLDRSLETLRSWDWTHGKTPPFTVDTTLDLRDTTLDPLDQGETSPSTLVLRDQGSSATVRLEVKAGRLQRCDLRVPPQWLPGASCRELAALLVGSRFCPSEMAAIAAAFLRSGPPDPRLRNLCDNIVALM